MNQCQVRHVNDVTYGGLEASLSGASRKPHLGGKLVQLNPTQTEQDTEKDTEKETSPCLLPRNARA